MKTDLPSLAHTRVWRAGEVVSTDLPLSEVREQLAQGDTIAWIDLFCPSSAELGRLAQELELGETLVEDAIGPSERPKLTRHGRRLFFTTYATWLEAKEDGFDGLRTARVSGILHDHALITIRLSDELGVEALLERWQENADLVALGPLALMHGLLDLVVDGHFAVIQRLDDQVEELEDVLFEEGPTDREFMRRTFGLRKDLVGLRRVVLPMREVVSALIRHRPADREHTEIGAWLDDLYDHVLRASEWTESLRDMITTVFETNLSLQDARLNTIMRQLAAWASIIAVPTAITGWFGQNIPYPGFAHPLGLWLSVVLVVACSLGLYLGFRRRGWL